MEEPVFPQKFVKNHCPKVLEARDWRKIYKVPGTDEDDVQFAECAFHEAGCGMLCEACDLHLTRPFLGHKIDEEFLPQIEQYYEDLAKYEKQTRAQPKPVPIIAFYLTWFEKIGDGYLGESLLADVTEKDVRRKFGLNDTEYPGDCLVVKEHHLSWLAVVARGVRLDLDEFDYFVEARQAP